MKFQFHKIEKFMVLGLSVFMLNLLLFATPGWAVMAGSLETGQPVHSHSQHANSVTCHKDMNLMSVTEKSVCNQHPDNTCEDDCATCVMAHLGIPVHLRQFIQEASSDTVDISIRLISLDYSPNPPPPKRFS